ncbi:winged helix-turn-helix transcriptional regulator [Microtetraspora sp. AC03309]|uniref:winged helix-turn-helix domain-containing protein n=1 Tax=Microtetraspora sp. AC03309 TaxID=2779376 RepID=UPI001E2C81D7|nr:winged helix-turn-helix domain-containing protein [Microtetraspora sp. AC03309]MCC5574436.1 winged helix-turn-helix transcriptional regulator [Microtetraspora sp. AC03309]
MIMFDEDRTVWEQVYELLRARIEGDVYKERRPIPSSVHLVEELGVAQNTIRKAVLRLKAEGFVRPINGKGTYVRPREEWSPPGDE